MQVSEAQRLRELESENAKPNGFWPCTRSRALWDRALAPQACGEADPYHVQRTPLFERCACHIVGLSRDSYRYPPQADQAAVELHKRLVEIVQLHCPFGYRLIHDLLRTQFPASITSVCTVSTGSPTWPCAVARRASALSMSV